MIEIVAVVDRMIRSGNVSAFFAPVSDENFLSSGSRSVNGVLGNLSPSQVMLIA